MATPGCDKGTEETEQRLAGKGCGKSPRGVGGVFRGPWVPVRGEGALGAQDGSLQTLAEAGALPKPPFVREVEVAEVS